MTTLRVVVAEDSVLLREGLVRLLADHGFDVVAQTGDGDELVRLVTDLEPDVAVVDIRMPPSGTDEGLRAADRIAELHPATGVLVISDHLEPEYASRLLDDGTPGRGYVLKDNVIDVASFVDAVRRVAAAETVVDEAIVRRLLARLRRQDPIAHLTPREREILSLMAEGRSNAGIAQVLSLSERTVEAHASGVFLKLGLDGSPNDHRRVLAVLAFLRE